MWTVVRCPSLRRTQCFGQCSAISVLTFLIIFEQAVLCFHFALGPTNYIVTPAWHTAGILCSWESRGWLFLWEEGVPRLGQVPYEVNKTKWRQGQEVGGLKGVLFSVPRPLQVPSASIHSLPVLLPGFPSLLKLPASMLAPLAPHSHSGPRLHHSQQLEELCGKVSGDGLMPSQLRHTRNTGSGESGCFFSTSPRGQYSWLTSSSVASKHPAALISMQNRLLCIHNGCY